MGTTVTTNLSLIKPDSNEPIPNWPAQNGANMDILDGVFRNTQNTWVPVITGETVNPSFGIGSVVEGKFLRLWPKMVFAHLRVFMGTSGFTAGTGRWRFSLPVTPCTDLQVFNQEYPIGKAIVRSSGSVANSAVMECMYDIAGNFMIMRSSGGNYMSATIPFTWGNNDWISAHMIYPTAAP